MDWYKKLVIIINDFINKHIVDKVIERMKLKQEKKVKAIEEQIKKIEQFIFVHESELRISIKGLEDIISKLNDLKVRFDKEVKKLNNN